jgi:hypothetical protein
MTGCDGGEHGRAGFGAKGLKLIIVVVQLGVAVKIYFISLPPKLIDGFLSFIPR